jgi:hypothetical protein
MATKKSKFQTNLEMSHKDIKGKRAKIFFEDGKEHSAELVRDLRSKGRTLERKLLDLEDFHADSTTSLKVTTNGFDSKEWILQMNNVTNALKLHSVKIKTAEDIHKEWFNETVE